MRSRRLAAGPVEQGAERATFWRVRYLEGGIPSGPPPMAAQTTKPTQKLGVMTFNSATGDFTNFLAVADDTGSPAETRPGWPALTRSAPVAHGRVVMR